MVSRGPFVRRAAVLCGAVVAVLAFAAAPAATATPCGEAVILDWSDGTLDRVYSVACYRDALARLPEDLRAYSTAPEDIERALLEAARADSPAETPAAESGEAPRSLAGPTRTPTTTEEDDAAPTPTETEPPASSDAARDAVAAPVAVEPAASDRTPALVIAALVLLATGAAIPLARAVAARRRGA
jgi:hypothetical protein